MHYSICKLRSLVHHCREMEAESWNSQLHPQSRAEGEQMHGHFLMFSAFPHLHNPVPQHVKKCCPYWWVFPPQLSQFPTVMSTDQTDLESLSLKLAFQMIQDCVKLTTKPNHGTQGVPFAKSFLFPGQQCLLLFLVHLRPVHVGRLKQLIDYLVVWFLNELAKKEGIFYLLIEHSPLPMLSYVGWRGGIFGKTSEVLDLLPMGRW